MKKTRKILSVILSIITLISVIPVTASAAETSGTCGENLTWTFDDTTGTLTISGEGDMYNYNKTNQPWNKYKTKVGFIVIDEGVTSIGVYAFFGCKYIEAIKIPDSVKSINSDAFARVELESVYIPASITFIHEDAFFGCLSLDFVYYEGTINQWNNLSYTNYPSERTAIICSDGNLFPSGTCGDNVTWVLDTTTKTLRISGEGDIKSNALFQPWGNVKSQIERVIINEGVTSIGAYAFYNCEYLTEITLPYSIEKIGRYAFTECDSLTEITITDGVISIEEGAFRASPIECIKIGKNLKSISDSTFQECSKLKKIIVDTDNQYYSSDEYGVLFNKDKTTLLQYPRANSQVNYTISDSVTTINDGAFYDCSKLESVVIGSSVIMVGECAFESCGNLKSIVIGNGVTTIGSYAFSECSNLNSVVIGNSVTSIGDYAFNCCEKLTDIIIPDSVTTIGTEVFKFCNNLKCVRIGKRVKSMGMEVFWACLKLERIIVDADNQYYSNDEYGVLFNKEKTILIRYPHANLQVDYIIPDSVISIERYAFSACSNLAQVTVPGSVTSIGIYAFESCSNLKSIVIGNGVNLIGHMAFYRNNSLTDVYYTGTQEEWKAVSIVSGNTELEKANVHFATEVITQPTCTEYGYTEYLWSQPDKNYIADYTSPIGHDYSTITVTTETCTEKGYTTHTCAACDDSYKTDYVDATGHEYATPTYTAPPCVAKGYTIYECHCGASRLADFVDVTGHIDSDSDGLCEQCNKSVGAASTNTPDTDTSGIFSIFNIIIQLLKQILNSLNLLSV